MLTQIDVMSNMGGVTDAWFVYESDIASFLKLPGTHELVVELASGKSWTPIYMSPDAELNEDISDDAAGLLFSPYLKMRYPGITAAISHQNTLLLGRKLLVKVKTSNGSYVYIGTPDNPAVFTFRKMNGGAAGSFSGYELMLRSNQHFSMLFASTYSILGNVDSLYTLDLFDEIKEKIYASLEDYIGNTFSYALSPGAEIDGVSLKLSIDSESNYLDTVYAKRVFDSPVSISTFILNITETDVTSWGTSSGDFMIWIHWGSGVTSGQVHLDEYAEGVNELTMEEKQVDWYQVSFERKDSSASGYVSIASVSWE